MSKFTGQQIAAIAEAEVREIEKTRITGTVTITLEANQGAVARIRTNRERLLQPNPTPGHGA